MEPTVEPVTSWSLLPSSCRRRARHSVRGRMSEHSGEHKGSRCLLSFILRACAQLPSGSLLPLESSAPARSGLGAGGNLAAGYFGVVARLLSSLSRRKVHFTGAGDRGRVKVIK